MTQAYNERVRAEKAARKAAQIRKAPAEAARKAAEQAAKEAEEARLADKERAIQAGKDAIIEVSRLRILLVDEYKRIAEQDEDLRLANERAAAAEAALAEYVTRVEMLTSEPSTSHSAHDVSGESTEQLAPDGFRDSNRRTTKRKRMETSAPAIDTSKI